MRVSIIFAAALALVACALQPKLPAKPYYTEDILVVSKDDAYNFWIPEEGSVREALVKSNGPPGSGGCFRVSVIIDSNGRLFDPKSPVMVGPAGMDDWVPRFLSVLRYRPAKENVNRTPIQTVLDWSMFKVGEVGMPAASRFNDRHDAGTKPSSESSPDAACEAKMDELEKGAPKT